MSRKHLTTVPASDAEKPQDRRSWLSRLFRRMKPDEIQVSNNGKVTAVYSDKSELKELVAIERERLEIDRELLGIERERLDIEKLEHSPKSWAS